VSDLSIARTVPVPDGLVTWKAEDRRDAYPLKRPLDIGLAAFGLLLAAPIFAVVALAVKLEDGGPVFYSQDRIGLGDRPFKLRKFRSMVPDAEKRSGPTWATADDPRITRVGRILRRTACDELPQLLSILRGDMSFVGPRSHRAHFYQQFAREIPAYRERYQVQPGLTGLAQLFAKYDSSALQKLRFDLLYARHQGLALDVKLIAASIAVTVLGRWDERTGRKLPWLARLIRLGTGRR
jgi:lipopolysaccharide/colanic/teichoic acid biosynthesis glycosyltransferase